MKKSLYNQALKQWKKGSIDNNLLDSMKLVVKKKRGNNVKGNNKNFKTI